MSNKVRSEYDPKSGQHRLQSEKGEVVIRFPERSVLEVEASRYVDKALVEPALAAIETGLARRPPVDVFCACAGVDGYDSKVRQLLTGWLTENLDRVISVNVLATNNLVRMGVTVANIRLSGFIWTWEHPKRFEDEIAYRVTECQRGVERADRPPPTADPS